MEKKRIQYNIDNNINDNDNNSKLDEINRMYKILLYFIDCILEYKNILKFDNDKEKDKDDSREDYYIYCEYFYNFASNLVYFIKKIFVF